MSRRRNTNAIDGILATTHATSVDVVLSTDPGKNSIKLNFANPQHTRDFIKVSNINDYRSNENSVILDRKTYEASLGSVVTFTQLIYELEQSSRAAEPTFPLPQMPLPASSPKETGPAGQVVSLPPLPVKNQRH